MDTLLGVFLIAVIIAVVVLSSRWQDNRRRSAITPITPAPPLAPLPVVPAPATPVDRRGNVPRSVSLHYIALTMVALAWAIAAYAFSGHSFTTFGVVWNTGLVLVVFGIFHFVAGIETVDIDHLVGAYFFGYPTIQVTGGVLIAPWGIFSKTKNRLRTFNYEFPTEPQNIWRGDESTCPDGKRPPIRIPFSDPHDNYPYGITNDGIRNGDPLHRRSTNEVSFITRWRILDEYNFRRNVGLTANARDQMEDIGVSFLNEVLTKMPLSVAMFNIAIINAEFEKTMREKTSHWGIDLIDGRIKLIELSHNLNSSIQEIPMNAAKAQGATLLAEGEKAKRTLEGQGAAAAAQALAKAELDGRTDGLKRMKDELSLKPEEILAAETARSIGQSPSDKIIFGATGLAETLGVGAAITNALKSTNKTGTTTP